ncbi:MAG: hypothetical protein QHH75_05400 [Bacillota bacterium]|jgi:hypothetical protein|nr:hypothetical protein [Bacillota bacterium]
MPIIKVAGVQVAAGLRGEDKPLVLVSGSSQQGADEHYKHTAPHTLLLRSLLRLASARADTHSLSHAPAPHFRSLLPARGLGEPTGMRWSAAKTILFGFQGS